MPEWLILLLGIVGGCGALGGIFGVISSCCARKKEEREKRFQNRFIHVRAYIKDRRHELQQKAKEIHSSRSNGIKLHSLIPLLVGKDWIPEKPIELDNLKLTLVDDIGPTLLKKEPGIDGFEKYTDAIIAMDKPAKMRNNRQYRLLDVNLNGLVFSKKEYHYFDKINFGGFLDFELASAVKYGTKRSISAILMKRLNTPHQSIVLTGVNTLTLLNDRGKLRLIMHLRGKNETALAQGTYHVIPAGEFQPSCVAPSSFEEDFNLWKNILRESAEELACIEEYDGNSGIPFDYGQEPFLSLEKEKSAGNIKPFYLGIGLDPITFQGEILTCVVYKEDIFKSIFTNIISKGHFITSQMAHF